MIQAAMAFKYSWEFVMVCQADDGRGNAAINALRLKCLATRRR